MATVPHLCHPRQSAAANAQPNARDTRALGPAAAQALQTTLLVIFVLLPLLVPLWALFSFVVVPIAARGLRNTDSRFDRAAVVLSQGSVLHAVGDHAGRPGAELLASQLCTEERERERKKRV